MISTVVSIAGLVGLFYSLHLTREAVKAATDASEDADKALQIAERNARYAAEQVEIARHTAEKHLRAYVMAGSLKATGLQPGKTPVFWYDIKNRGLTPARQIVLKTCLVRCEDPERIPIRLVGTNATFELGAGQGMTQDDPVNHSLTKPQFDSLVLKEVTYVLAGYISYRDVFGRLRRTIFRGWLDIEAMDENGTAVLVIAHKHIRST